MFQLLEMSTSKYLLWVSTSAADAAVVNFNGIKTLLAKVWGTFSIIGKPFFRNSPRCQPRNLSDCIVLDNWVFDNFILGNKLFGKSL